MSVTPTGPIAPPPAGQQPARLTVTIHRAKLAQFLQSGRKIGPMTCRQWSKKLEQCFAGYSAQGANVEFRSCFPDLGTYLSLFPDPVVHGGLRARAISSLRMQFQAGMNSELANELRLPHQKIFDHLLVFMALKQLSARLELWQKEGEPVTGLVREGNALLADISAKLNCRYVIN